MGGCGFYYLLRAIDKKPINVTLTVNLSSRNTSTGFIKKRNILCLILLLILQLKKY